MPTRPASIALHARCMVCLYLLMAWYVVPAAAQNEQILDGGTWVGTFEQLSPVRWRGDMQLTLEYDLSGGSPWPVSGVLHWPGLGGAKTEIRGSRQGTRLEFVEKKCRSRCTRIQLGGNYRGSFNPETTILRGTAEIPSMKFKGRFILERVMQPDLP